MLEHAPTSAALLSADTEEPAGARDSGAVTSGKDSQG